MTLRRSKFKRALLGSAERANRAITKGRPPLRLRCSRDQYQILYEGTYSMCLKTCSACDGVVEDDNIFVSEASTTLSKGYQASDLNH